MNRTIIARGLAVILLALALAGCSMLRLAYGQADSLLYWWIDGYADLQEPQTAQLRRDIDAYLAWHRDSELPGYVTRLQAWQQMAQSESTPEMACQQFDVLRAAYLRLIERGLEPMAKLALSLSPQQLQHMQRKYARNNREFEQDFIRVSDEERLDHLTDKALERYETLYGRLNPAQVRLLRERIRASGFDAARINAERLRRQGDLLRTLRDLQADRGTTTATAVIALRRWHERVMQSPIPGFAAYSESLIRNGCEQFAAVHNSTTPEQRAHAVHLLKAYESDFRILLARD
ncbi:MAG: hypothetical protein JNK17_15125 [Hydrogenophaga sp.]|nr:hypothetical protein [Hydrogenophaga sp.]